MKKSDLKTGMVVELNNGKQFLVLLNGESLERDLINLKGGWMPLRTYNEDLTYSDDGWSIKKVLSVGNLISQILNDGKWAMAHAKVLWEREEAPIEMTVAEIEEKLGIKNLKIVKE